MDESAAMSALTSGDIPGFLAGLPADEIFTLAWPDGDVATVVRVGTIVLRSGNGSDLDAHGHDSADEAHACFELNSDQARTVIGRAASGEPEPSIPPALAALMAALGGGGMPAPNRSAVGRAAAVPGVVAIEAGDYPGGMYL